MKAAGLAFRARSSPLLAHSFRSSFPGMSKRTTGTPALAKRAAIPLPIVPAPTTPTFLIMDTSLY
jgi:hypothetical protein